jgi:ABC-type polysaccharide/polyol phosphate export permease
MKNSFIISLLSGILVSLILPILLFVFFYEATWGIGDYIFALMYVFLFVMSYGLVVSVISFKAAPLNNVKSTIIRLVVMLLSGALPLLYDLSMGYISIIAALLYFIFNELFKRFNQLAP